MSRRQRITRSVLNCLYVSINLDFLAKKDVSEFLESFYDTQKFSFRCRVARLRVRQFAGIECDRPSLLRNNGPSWVLLASV